MMNVSQFETPRNIPECCHFDFHLLQSCNNIPSDNDLLRDNTFINISSTAWSTLPVTCFFLNTDLPFTLWVRMSIFSMGCEWDFECFISSSFNPYSLSDLFLWCMVPGLSRLCFQMEWILFSILTPGIPDAREKLY